MFTQNRSLVACVAVLVAFTSVRARAEDSGAQAPSENSVAPTPAPYVVPFQLRSAALSNVVRVDSAIAFADGGTTVAPNLMAMYKVLPTLGVMARVTYSALFPKTGSTSGAFANPLVGVSYAPTLSRDWKLSVFGGVSLPIGQGGGSPADPAQASAITAGRLARSAMDNAIFTVNYSTIALGGSLAYLWNRFTFQVDLTLLEGFRVRGATTQDSAVTNSTENLWIAYSFMPEFSLGVELRHQQFLSTPAAVRANATARDQTTLALGARTRIPLGGIVIPLGVSFARALDNPMSGQHYNILFVDIPIVF